MGELSVPMYGIVHLPWCIAEVGDLSCICCVHKFSCVLNTVRPPLPVYEKQQLACSEHNRNGEELDAPSESHL